MWFLIFKVLVLSLTSQFELACVASISVRLSARSMHFSLFWPRENWGRHKKVRGGGGERREGNACPQTPRFWKTHLSTNGVSWLVRHGSVDCQVINPSIKSGMCIWAWPALTQWTGSRYRGILVTITIFTWSSSQDHFCPYPTADLKYLQQAFSDTEESTQTFLRQGLLPDRVWSSRFNTPWVDRLFWRSLGNSRLATNRTPNNFE